MYIHPPTCMVDSVVLLLHALSFIRRLAIICILLSFVRGKGEILKIIISYLCACSNFNSVMQRRKEGGKSCNCTHMTCASLVPLLSCPSKRLSFKS